VAQRSVAPTGRARPSAKMPDVRGCGPRTEAVPSAHVERAFEGAQRHPLGPARAHAGVGRPRRLFSSGSGPAATVSDGLVINEPCAGGLRRWLRSSTGEWIGLVTYVVQMEGGGTFKATDQLVPARALRPR
jgi:hypothetical protein